MKFETVTSIIGLAGGDDGESSVGHRIGTWYSLRITAFCSFTRTTSLPLSLLLEPPVRFLPDFGLAPPLLLFLADIMSYKIMWKMIDEEATERCAAVLQRVRAASSVARTIQWYCFLGVNAPQSLVRSIRCGVCVYV